MINKEGFFFLIKFKVLWGRKERMFAFIFLEFSVFCLLLVLDVWRGKEMRLSVSWEWDVQSAAYYSNESCEVAVLSVDVFIYLFICKIAAPIGSTRTPWLLFLEALFSFFTRLWDCTDMERIWRMWYLYQKSYKSKGWERLSQHLKLHLIIY